MQTGARRLARSRSHSRSRHERPARSRRRQASASREWPASPERSPGRRHRSDGMLADAIDILGEEKRPRIDTKLIADLGKRLAPSAAPVEEKLPNGEKAPLQRRRRRSSEGRETFEKEKEDLLTDDDSHEGDDDVEAVERLWVFQKDCAKIVGRAGRNLKEIEAESRVQMKVQREEGADPAVKERYIDLTGTSRVRDKAVTLILEQVHYCRTEEGTVLKDERHVTEDGETVVDSMALEVLVEEVGKVLGRGGEIVKKMEKESGARIDVQKTTGQLELFGCREAQDRCLELVLREVSFVKAQDGTIIKDERRGPGESSAILAVDRPVDETPPIKLFVSDQDAGKIIGRGGEQVREIKEKTGADIQVPRIPRDEHGKSGSDREILIYGGASQREEAKEVILGIVSWCQDIDGNFIKELPPPVEKKKPVEREEKRRRETLTERQKRGEQTKRDRDMERLHNKPCSDSGKPQSKKGWVCSQCGGDHRTKECPHAAGSAMTQMSMQMSMQMGMQMAMQGMMPMMAMQAMMGSQQHAMRGMPGSMAGAPAIPGMAGVPPHMMMPQSSGRRRRRDASPIVAAESGSRSVSEANAPAEGAPNRSYSPTALGRHPRQHGNAYTNGIDLGSQDQAATSQVDAAPRRRRRRFADQADGRSCSPTAPGGHPSQHGNAYTKGGGLGSQDQAAPSEVEAAPRRRRRRFTQQAEGSLEPLPRGPEAEGEPQDGQDWEALRGRVANLHRKRPRGTR